MHRNLSQAVEVTLAKIVEKERYGTFMGNCVCSNLRCIVKDRVEKICQARL